MQINLKKILKTQLFKWMNIYVSSRFIGDPACNKKSKKFAYFRTSAMTRLISYRSPTLFRIAGVWVQNLLWTGYMILGRSAEAVQLVADTGEQKNESWVTRLVRIHTLFIRNKSAVFVFLAVFLFSSNIVLIAGLIPFLFTTWSSTHLSTDMWLFQHKAFDHNFYW